MQRFFFKLMTMKVNVFLVLNSPRCCSVVETRKYLRLPTSPALAWFESLSPDKQ